MNDVNTQEARLARLQERRGAAGRTHHQLHRTSPALGSKIATAGFAGATIFGMVTAMTWTQHAVAAKNTVDPTLVANTTAGTTASTAATPDPTAVTTPPKVIVRVHHVKAGSKVPQGQRTSGVKPATPVKKATHKPVVIAPVVKAPVSTCTATSTHACP
jgi:hypothetical protein